MKAAIVALADSRGESEGVIVREALAWFLCKPKDYKDKDTGANILAETTAHYGPLVSPETLLEDAKRNLRNSASITANSSKVKKASA